MKEDVKAYVHICVKSQNIKLVYKKEFKLYRPFIDINKFVWECINGLYYMSLEWQGKDAIMVVVDMFSKLAKFGLVFANSPIIRGALNSNS
jgi:hypothetical protein